MKPSKILITCPKRITPFLQQEIEDLGYTIENVLPNAVEISGTLLDCMRLNFYLRTAASVLFLIRQFEADDAEMLYSKMYDYEWDKFLAEDGYFCITSSVHNETINNNLFVNVKCKDAIADYFMDKHGIRPDSGPERHKSNIFIYWKETTCSVYLDTSGQTLSKHNYRKQPFAAPMMENLASACLLASAWDRKSNFVNPMCGSGTLAIEAALLALNKAPGLLRNNYGFMHFKTFDETEWNKIREEGKAKALKKLPFKIIVTDINPEAIEHTRNNAITAGVEHLMEFKVCDFRETPIPEGGGIVIFNPEYGERLGETTELENTYSEMGDFLKKQCKGYWGYVFTGNLELAKKIGLKAKRRIEFFNGTIDCRLLEYELYDGSKKTFKND
jgi:putative N6-adenine-specific DNA methylase